MERLELTPSAAASEIIRLIERVLELAPTAGLYVEIKVKPASEHPLMKMTRLDEDLGLIDDESLPPRDGEDRK